jgi:hypothetical protein
MAAYVLKRFNQVTLAATTAVQLVSASGGGHNYTIINLGTGNLFIRMDQAPTGTTDPAAMKIPANYPPLPPIFVSNGLTGLYVMADAAGSISVSDAPVY